MAGYHVDNMSFTVDNYRIRVPRMRKRRKKQVFLDYSIILLLSIPILYEGCLLPCNAAFFVDIMSFVDSLFGVGGGNGGRNYNIIHMAAATAPTTPGSSKSRARSRFATNSANITLPYMPVDKVSANDAGNARGGPGGVLVSVSKHNLFNPNVHRLRPAPPPPPPNQRRKTNTSSPANGRDERKPPSRRPNKLTPQPTSNPASNPSSDSPLSTNGTQSRRESPLSPPPPPTKRTARSPAAVTPVRHRSPGIEATTLMPEREEILNTGNSPAITATTTPSGVPTGIASGMPRGNGSSIESVPHVFNPYFGIGPQHNIITEAITTTTTAAPTPTEQRMKPMINFVNVVAGKPMGLVDVFGMVGGSEVPPISPATAAVAPLPVSSSTIPTDPPVYPIGGGGGVGAVEPPVSSDGASSGPVVIPTGITGPPGLEMPAFDIPVTDPKITVNEQNQTGYQQNTWREFLEEIADECPNNDMLHAEEIGPERFAHKTNPPKGVTIPASQTTRSPEFFVENVDAGKGAHICLWAKQMLTKLGHVATQQPPAAPGIPTLPLV